MKINLVVMGGFTFPNGMAATKRVQNVIDSLKGNPDVTVRVVVQRQSLAENDRSGVHRGTPYHTVMGDVFRGRMILALPSLCLGTDTALKKALRPGCRNVLYFYGPPVLEAVGPLGYARRLGYKLVFDLTEDYDFAKGMSRSVYHYLTCCFIHLLSSRMKSLASGIVVVSSHLQQKYERWLEGRVPVHYLPVSVQMDRFSVGAEPASTRPLTILFYSGSFGQKDGVPVLLDSFEKLAAKHQNLRLVLTGRGNQEAMSEFVNRREGSRFKNSIDYKGYLDDEAYYSALGSADIPCMTRIDLAFANAGFPFKLGEFLASGKPVVASRVSDVERFLTDRQNAMLVAPGSSEDICEAVDFLIGNPALAATIGARGREVARQHFDFEQQGKALLAFLENL